jgi:hypothetical protein
MIVKSVVVALFFVTSAIPALAHGRHHHRHHYMHSDGTGLTRVALDNGHVIVVASRYADRFRGFLNALYHRYGSLPDVQCYSSGHMRNSLHHWGGACDVGQRARNVAWRAMYHVGSLAAEYGLTDGCIWRHPDCGHVQIGGGQHRYASRHYRHYARHHYRHYAAREN